MLAELSKALDDCLERRLDGESLEACLDDYPELRARLEPLLTTAAFAAAAPRVSPSKEFRVASQARLIVRLHERSRQRTSARPQRGEGLLKALGPACRKLIQALGKPRPLAVPATLLLLLAAAGSVSVIAGIGLPGQPSALASQCTFSLLSGSAQVQIAGSDRWQMAGDGMVLAAGTRVRTAPDSHAVLTFFEGSSLTLEPNTDVEIQSVEGSAGSSTDIVLKQWIGKTWSRVVKRLDAGTRYEIVTPSACALVRGTLFETEVDGTLSTTVRTTEGLVSVAAKGKEVFLPAGQEASVDQGATPSEPRPIAPAANELLITVGLPAVASVCDPGGSSVGYLPDGFAFNQIPGAQSTSPSDGLQVIRVPNPVPGEYSLVLRSAVGGASQVSLALLSTGQPAFTHADAYRIPRGTEWLVPFTLRAEDGRLVDVEVGDIRPLSGASPENLIRPAATVAPTASAEATLEPTEPAPSLLNYTLTLVSSDGGSVDQPGQGVFLFHAGAVVTIVAEADAGWVFDRWIGDVADIAAPSTTVKMSKPQAIAAIFVRQT